MSDARSRGWGDPDAPNYQRAYIITIAVGGIRLNVRREVAPLFDGFIRNAVLLGHRFDRVADDWGYANRDVRGFPGVKSNHAWGLAIDLDATENPMLSGAPRTTFTPPVVAAAARWGLAWGGAYRSRPDPMHFEFLGRPSDVDRYPLLEPEAAPAYTPPPDPEDIAVARTAPDIRRPRLDNGRVPFFRWLDGTDPTRVRVLGYNGAQLQRVDGSGYGVPYMDVTGLAGPVLDLVTAADGSVVLTCEDGGTIDCAAP